LLTTEPDSLGSDAGGVGRLRGTLGAENEKVPGGRIIGAAAGVAGAIAGAAGEAVGCLLPANVETAAAREPSQRRACRERVNSSLSCLR